MAGKIGFVRFTAFDGPSPTEFDAYKKLTRVLEPGNRVKTLAESHPAQPPMRIEPPALSRTPDHRVYKLAAELAPLMDEFHSRILDRARIRERLKMIERTRFQNDMAEIKHYRQVDLLHSWITELLFERVYRRVLRDLAMQEKVAKREWLEGERFHEWHHEKRVADAKIYPDLHRKELVHPYKFEIKLPNDRKALETAQEHIRDERHIVKDAHAHAWNLRQILHDIIFDEVKLHLRQQYVNRREHFDKEARWHMHDVQRAFDKAWVHAWERRDVFRDLIRQGIIEQAEYYPKLFKKDLQNPYEMQIREPNDKTIKEKIKEHLDRERQQQTLVKLEAEADRILLKDNKLELDAYRQVASERIEAKRTNSQWQQHVLVERHDEQALERREHVSDARQVESQGYQLLAGRMIPQPRFGIDADLITRVALPLGLNGDPRAPEHVAPSPMLLTPQQQRENWHKIRETQIVEQRADPVEQAQAWEEKTQSIRQNLAAIDYAEQLTRELQKRDGHPVDRRTDSDPNQDVANVKPASETGGGRKTKA